VFVKKPGDTSDAWIESDETESTGYKSENSDDLHSYISNNNNNIDDEEMFDNTIINKDLLHEIEYGVE
jgi:hypothetical protein